MNKKYIKPTAKVVELNCSSILAGSDPKFRIPTDGKPDVEFDAKETVFTSWDDEE